MEDLVGRNTSARSVQRTINERLIRSLSRNALEQTAKRLGIWERGGVAIERPAVGDLLVDCAIYDYLAGETNAVGRLAKRRPFAAGTSSLKERAQLAAMLMHMAQLEAPDAAEYFLGIAGTSEDDVST